MRGGLGLFCCWEFSVCALPHARAWAQSGITNQNGRNVTCASDDMKRHLCRVDTSRGVQMTNQRSGSPCIQGQTWGYDRQGIWVDRGCRADFFLGGGGPTPPPGGTVTCSSNDGRRNYFPANTSRGVQLVTQRQRLPVHPGPNLGLRQPEHLGGSRLPGRFPPGERRTGFRAGTGTPAFRGDDYLLVQ